MIKVLERNGQFKYYDPEKLSDSELKRLKQQMESDVSDHRIRLETHLALVVEERNMDYIKSKEKAIHYCLKNKQRIEAECAQRKLRNPEHQIPKVFMGIAKEKLSVASYAEIYEMAQSRIDNTSSEMISAY